MDKELHRISITGIIYNDEGKYLVTRRSLQKKAFPGMWTVPGGGLNTDDYTNTPPTTSDGLQWYNTVEKTLRREIMEEVGVEIERPNYLLDLTFIRPDNIPVLVLSFYCKYAGGQVDISKEPDTIEYAWANLDELKSYDLIPGIFEEIEMVDKILKNKNG